MSLYAPHMQQPIRQQRARNIRNAHGRPKEPQSQTQLMVLVKVAEVQNHIGDEATLEDTQQSTAGKERGPPLKPELSSGDDGPQNHLRGNPPVGTHPLGDELRGKFGAEKG